MALSRQFWGHRSIVAQSLISCKATPHEFYLGETIGKGEGLQYAVHSTDHSGTTLRHQGQQKLAGPRCPHKQEIPWYKLMNVFKLVKSKTQEVVKSHDAASLLVFPLLLPDVSCSGEKCARAPRQPNGDSHMSGNS